MTTARDAIVCVVTEDEVHSVARFDALQKDTRVGWTLLELLLRSGIPFLHFFTSFLLLSYMHYI